MLFQAHAAPADRNERSSKRQLRSFLEKMAFDALSQAGKVDYLLLRERLLREQNHWLARPGETLR